MNLNAVKHLTDLSEKQKHLCLAFRKTTMKTARGFSQPTWIFHCESDALKSLYATSFSWSLSYQVVHSTAFNQNATQNMDVMYLKFSF